MSKRLVWADITGILAIYLVVALHVNLIPQLSQTNFIYCIGLTLADNCVPLLVMLSGALLLGKQESYSVFLRKRVSRVVIPWIT
jgi:surface polysaccharide O-acyltransferase-like enzyme